MMIKNKNYIPLPSKRSKKNKPANPQRLVQAVLRREGGRDILSAFVPEVKHLLINPNGSASSAPTISYLAICAQGDTDASRTGDAIQFLGLTARWTVIVADTTNFFRFIVFRDVNSDGVVPDSADVLVDASQVTSPMNPIYRKRFKVYHDEVVPISNTGPAAACGKFSFRAKFPIGYIGTTAAQTSAGTNSVYVLLMSDSGAASHPQYYFYSDLEYVDL